MNKNSISKKENAESQSATGGIVLVGTYKDGQLDWIMENGIYNYPVRDGDDLEAESWAKVKELWLYAGAKAERHCLAAEFSGIQSRDEFLAAYPTYVKLGKGRHARYAVFKVKPLDYGPAIEGAKVFARASDFSGGRSKKVAEAIKAFQNGGDFASLADYLPSELADLPHELLCVSEGAVQLELFYGQMQAECCCHVAGTPTLVQRNVADETKKYMLSTDVTPLFFCGDALAVLRQIPDCCIDCCMTSPPYWNKRQYLNGGIGLEQTFDCYIEHLLSICAEIYRVLKPTGSFWLNIGDSYLEKNLLNIPSRLAIKMQDLQGWVLRNTVIWNKVKGCPDNSLDKLRNVYEPIFHFVKKSTGYFYDIDLIRNKPHAAKVVNGAVVSATGVSGVKYKRKIELSTVLSEEQKKNAMNELMKILEQVRKGEVSDFRMIILGEQRTTHSDSEMVSGRARELHEKGFYFLKYNPKGSKPSDLWDIIPEDSQGRESHFAPYPEDLCVAPLKLTCPRGGLVLDPFAGTGTTMKVARSLGMKSIGIDISRSYVEDAIKRISGCFVQGDLLEEVGDE